jgi:hypothetical protein
MDRGWSQGSKARIGAYTGPAGSLRCQTTRLLLAKKKPGRSTAGSEERRATVLVWCHESHDGMAWNEDRKVLKARWQCMNEW